MTIDRPAVRPHTAPPGPTEPVVAARQRRPVRLVLGLVLAVHSANHLLGFAAARGVVDLPLASHLVGPVSAVGWLAAGLLCATSGVLLYTAPRQWWVAGLAAVAASQSVIVTDWSDAWAGTAVNAVVLLAVLYGFASRGPWSLRAEYEQALAAARPPQRETTITETDLIGLPEPVQRYLRRVGVVGRPPVRDFRATWTGRMRSSPDSPWMPFTADQLDTVGAPRLFFKMDDTMKGLPVDVLHVFDERGATMRVRLLSLRSMVDATGPALTRAETVTLFNDLCLYAPGALIASAVTWESVDIASARAHFTLGPNTVTAELHFGEDGDLIDFVSDDRAATAADGSLLPAVRWSTPIRSYARFGSVRLPSRADVQWHPAGGSWTYGEFRLTSLSYNTGHPDDARQRHPGQYMTPPSPVRRRT